MNSSRAINGHRCRRPMLMLLALAQATSWAPAVPDAGEAAFPGKNGLIASASSRVSRTNPEGDPEIYTMKPDGSDLTQLTFNAADDIMPPWSPTGKRIAFASFRDGHNEVYAMKANGASQTNRTNNSASHVQPARLPSGKEITFSSHRDGNEKVYTMQANGTNPTNRSNHPTSDATPDWQLT